MKDELTINIEPFVSQKDLKDRLAKNPNIIRKSNFRYTDIFLYYCMRTSAIVFSIILFFLGAMYTVQGYESFEQIPQPWSAIMQALTQNNEAEIAASSQCTVSRVDICPGGILAPRLKAGMS